MQFVPLGYLLLLVLLFWPTGALLVQSWQHNPDYAHAWLLVPIVIWLMVRKQGYRDQGPELSSPLTPHLSSVPLSSCISVILGGFLHLTVQLIALPLLDYLAWFLMGRGALLALWDRSACRRATPAFLFTFFLFPLPMPWLNAIAHWLQDFVSQSAAALINLWTVCHQRGNMLYIAGLDEPFSVAAECSGLRQLMIFLAFGSLLACLLSGSWLRGIILIFAAVPIAILANVLRVVLLIGIAWAGNANWIQGLGHDMPLILTLPLGAAMLWFCYLKLKPESNYTRTTKDKETRGQGDKEIDRSLSPPVPLSPCLLVLFLLVCMQFGLQIHLQRAVKSVPVIDPALFDQLPWKPGIWVGKAHPQAEELAQKADFANATITRSYVNPAGQAVALYLVFSRTGRDRDHHPEICLRDAAGAREIKEERKQVALQTGTARFALRCCYQTQHLQQTTIYYWHYTILPEAKDALTALQNWHLQHLETLPSLTIQVQTNQMQPGQREAIETTFLPELDRWLAEHLPASAKVGHDQRSIRLIVN